MTFEKWADENGVCSCKRCRAASRAAWNAGRIELQERIASYEKTLRKANDIMFPPPLTRDDILDWVKSDEGRRRLREECLFIVYSGAKTHPDEYRSLAHWQPDRDTNQCRMVAAAFGSYGVGKNEDGRYWAWVKGKHYGYVSGVAAEELATCLAACIAELVQP